MNLSETAQLLYDKYGSINLNTKQLAEVLHYRNTRGLLNADSNGKCPVRTFKLGKNRVADIRDVASHLDEQRMKYIQSFE